MNEPNPPTYEQLADPCVMVIFGAAGDLTRRKLVPSLYNLVRNGLLGPQFAVIGVAMDPLDDAEFRRRMGAAIRQFGTGAFDPAVWEDLERRFYYVRGEFGEPGTYAQLKARVEEVAAATGCGGSVLYYLATPPAFFAEIAAQLGQAGLVRPPGDPAGWSRIVIEKPFGYDLDSARALNAQLLKVFAEEQIYRIDHYLGKETVQNILSFRFANGIFEPIWNRRYVDHVQITVAESIGVEGRGTYYEKAGVLRDIIQNHMFQLLCLVAMEPPISFEGNAVRDEKVKVLSAIKPMRPEQILKCTVRGQYGPGTIDGVPVPGYRQEPGVSPTSSTETYAALKLTIENWRWADVPFFLRSGKRLARHDTEIVIQFRRAPLLLVSETATQPWQPNRLRLHIQPDERISLLFQAKRPGPTLRLAPVEMEFRYSDLGQMSPSTGYETLLYDAMIGDPTLFHRADMVEAAWRVATPILDVWQVIPPRDFPNYAAGTWGPAAADELLAHDGRHWIEPS